MDLSSSKSKESKKTQEFRRNRRNKKKVALDDRVLSGGIEEWEKDETTVVNERIRPKGESKRKRKGISHDQAIARNEMSRVDKEAIEGLILEVHGKWCLVRVGKQNWRCNVRGKLRELNINQRSILTAGDRVQIEPTGELEGVIQEVQSRTNEIARQHLGCDHVAQVIVANVDQMIIVSSVSLPPLWPGLLDRYLIIAYNEEIKPVICINKIDLDVEGEAEPCIKEYYHLGYDGLLVSAQTNDGIDRLHEILKGKTSVFVGQSGVGKSTLLNKLYPDLNLRTGEVSKSTKKGRHVTTRARLYPTSSNGFIVDTPGVRGCNPFQLEQEKIHDAFPEIVEHAKHCRFPNCRHIEEPQCAILEAVKNGKILTRRYRSYLSVFQKA